MEIEKTTYSKLRAIPLSGGERLPTLREYLQAGMTGNMHTRLILEIKPSGVSKERGKQLTTAAFHMVQDLKATPWVVYISFDYDLLKKIRELSPDAPTQYLNGDRTPEELKADG